MFVHRHKIFAVCVAMFILSTGAAYSQLMPTTMGVKKTVRSRSTKTKAPRTSNRKTRTETVNNNESITIHGRTKKSAIEVENDETHWVGHDRIRHGRSKKSKSIKTRRPTGKRIKKSRPSTGDQPEMTRTKPRN